MKKSTPTPAETAAKTFFARVDVAGAKIAGITLGQVIGGWTVINVQDNSIVAKTAADATYTAAAGGNTSTL